MDSLLQWSKGYIKSSKSGRQTDSFAFCVESMFFFLVCKYHEASWAGRDTFVFEVENLHTLIIERCGEGAVFDWLPVFRTEWLTGYLADWLLV